MSNSGSAVEQDGKLKLGRSEWRGCVVNGIVFAGSKNFPSQFRAVCQERSLAAGDL